MISVGKIALVLVGLASLSLMAYAEVSLPDLAFHGDEKVAHSIQKRQAVNGTGTTDGTEPKEPLKLAAHVDEDYPIVFNILLWVGIMLFLATIAICASIASMDPGRDSLIYRVTSGQRFTKKDN